MPVARMTQAKKDRIPTIPTGCSYIATRSAKNRLDITVRYIADFQRAKNLVACEHQLHGRTILIGTSNDWDRDKKERVTQ